MQDFKLGGGGGGARKKIAPSGVSIGVFRVKNHDFTPANHIFSNFRGARAGCAPPPLDRPLHSGVKTKTITQKTTEMSNMDSTIKPG